jgi:hypothetical protein
VIGVDWQTFSLVEGRFALNLPTRNLSTARANVVAARRIRFPMVWGRYFPLGIDEASAQRPDHWQYAPGSPTASDQGTRRISVNN